MTTTQIVMLIAILAVLAVLVVRRGGPRVTHIETRREIEKKDSDDA